MARKGTGRLKTCFQRPAGRKAFLRGAAAVEDEDREIAAYYSGFAADPSLCFLPGDFDTLLGGLFCPNSRSSNGEERYTQIYDYYHTCIHRSVKTGPQRRIAGVRTEVSAAGVTGREALRCYTVSVRRIREVTRTTGLSGCEAREVHGTTDVLLEQAFVHSTAAQPLAGVVRHARTSRIPSAPCKPSPPTLLFVLGNEGRD